MGSMFPTKQSPKHWQLPKNPQVGKSHANKPAFQPFQRFSHALMTTFLSKIQDPILQSTDSALQQPRLKVFQGEFLQVW
jgi:hypothetical protein